jgi:hypothetical protein
MLILSTSAKTLDFDTPYISPNTTKPQFLKQAETISQVIKQLSSDQLTQTLSISPKLGQLNYQRYQRWTSQHTITNSRPAIFAYKGEVFKPLTLHQYTSKQLEYAQKSIRIVSGLYGLLRPLDLIQSYRLEMIAKLAIGSADNLYVYWSETVTAWLNQQVKQHKHPFMLNVASQAYAKIINKKQLACSMITAEFKEKRGGKYITVPIFSKIARGYMMHYCITNQVTTLDQVKKFNLNGYTLLDQPNDYTLTFAKS